MAQQPLTGLTGRNNESGRSIDRPLKETCRAAQTKDREEDDHRGRQRQTGLVTSKSTGRAVFDDAVVVAEAMVKGGGKKTTLGDALLTDEEFDQIQRAHFGRKTDAAAKARALKSLDDCLEAVAAFREITGIQPISRATADHCAAFQRKALTLSKNWRKQYPNSKKEVELRQGDGRGNAGEKQPDVSADSGGSSG